MATGQSSDELTFQLLDGTSVDDALLDQMLEVFISAFERWPAVDTPRGLREHLRWKLSGPSGWEGQALLGWAEGQLAAASTSHTRRYLVRGQERRVRLGADSAIHPRFQGRGYDTVRRAFLVQTMQPAFDLNLSYSRNPRIIHGGRRYGEASFGEPIDVLHRPVDLRRTALELRERRSPRLPATLWLGLLAARSVINRIRFRSPQRARTTIATAQAFDHRVDELIAQSAPQFDFVLLADRDFLNWRYCDERGGRYRVRIAEDGDQLLGYAVTRTSEERGYLVDLRAQNGRRGVVSGLVHDAVERLRADGVAGIDSWMPRRHPYYPLLRAEGFIPTPRATGCSVRGTIRDDPGDAEYLQRSGPVAHIMMGDSDFI